MTKKKGVSILSILAMVCCLFAWNGTTVSANEFPQEQEYFFDCNGGSTNITFDFGEGNVDTLSGDFIGGMGQVGSKVSDIVSNIDEPTYWESSRGFEGWLAYQQGEVRPDGTFDMILLTPEPISTSEVLGWTVPDYTVIFVAKWAGNDEDYYSEVLISGFGGLIPVEQWWGKPDGSIETENSETELCQNYFRKNDVPIFVQMENDYKITGNPVKSGATFEGWLEFSFNYIDNNGNAEYELVSEKILTTQEILERSVPEKNTLFAAKWSDRPMNDYYEEFKIDANHHQNYDVVIRNEFSQLPTTITFKYETVEEAKTEMVKVALESNKTMTTDSAKTAFMDIELKIKNANGDWETVSYENFPTEGVETVIPYPEGTNKDSFEFVVSHMICDGENAGTVEILEYTKEENGLKVTFHSMSPVAITYQEIKTSDNNDTNTDTDNDNQNGNNTNTDSNNQNGNNANADSNNQSSSTPENVVVKSPKTGDSTNMLLLFGMMIVGFVGICGSAYGLKKMK